MNFNPLTQLLRSNQKEIIVGVFTLAVAFITGVFLLISVAMSKDTPAPVVNNYYYSPTYNTVNEAAAPAAAPVYRAARPHKQHPKPAVKPLPRPICPCADSTEAGA